MNPEVRDEWVRRLRSGDYPQGGGQLRSPLGRFCCLGVLCELAGAVGVATYDPVEGGYRSVESPDEDPYTGQLPPAVVRWAGLTSPDPVVAGRSLSTWNDGTMSTARRTFADIATMIEEEL